MSEGSFHHLGEEQAVITGEEIEGIQARLSEGPKLLQKLLAEFDPETLKALLDSELAFSLEHLTEIPTPEAIDELIRQLELVSNPPSLKSKLEQLANALSPLSNLLLEDHRVMLNLEERYRSKRKDLLEITKNIRLDSAKKFQASYSDYHWNFWDPLYAELLTLRELRRRIKPRDCDDDISFARAIREGLEPKDHKTLRLAPNKEVTRVLEALKQYEVAEHLHSLGLSEDTVSPLKALLERLKAEIVLRDHRERYSELSSRLKAAPLEVFRSQRGNPYVPIEESYLGLTNQEKDLVVVALVHEIEQSGSNPFRFLWNRYLQAKLHKLLSVESEGLETFKRCLVAMSATSKNTDNKILQIILALPIDNMELIHRLTDYSHQFPEEESVKIALQVLKRKQLIGQLVEDQSAVAEAHKELSEP